MEGNVQWGEIGDRPIETSQEDRLSFAPYAEGLCSYVEECDTPATVAVQGDWGCGKTSMLRMVKGMLERKEGIECVWFDAWQYSQFQMEDRMEITFMQHFVDTLGGDSGAAEKAGSILKALVVGTANKAAGQAGTMAAEAILGCGEYRSFPAEVGKLKELFRKMVRRKLEEGKKRVVFFLDDLDRLRPVAAVRLLETLKVFFSCEGCVFLIAVDMDVVSQGTREKFGSGIADGKPERFFEKVVQMAFQLPVPHYRLDRMVAELLGRDLEDCRGKGWYRDVARLLAGGTPRGMKRLAGAFRLNDRVAGCCGLYPEEQEEAGRELVLVLSGIQLKAAKLHSHMVSQASFSFLNRIWDTDSREGMGRLLEETGFRGDGRPMGEYEDLMLLFSETLERYIGRDKGRMLFSEEMESVRRIMAMDMREDWVQPENDCQEGREMADAEEHPLFRRLDQVLSYYYDRENMKLRMFATIFDCHYRYWMKGSEAEEDWVCEVMFWRQESFPNVRLNSKLLEKGKPWEEVVGRMQDNLAFCYGKLQEAYGREAYRDQDFSGESFRVYTPVQASWLAQDIASLEKKLHGEVK